MDNIYLTNGSESLVFNALSWREHLTCKVAKRKVPLRLKGEIIDDKTYKLEPEVINITARLSDEELHILIQIYESHTILNLVNYDGYNGLFTYTAWLEKKPITYFHTHDGFTERKWKANLKFVIQTENYEQI